jgi:hypothetical protein
MSAFPRPRTFHFPSALWPVLVVAKKVKKNACALFPTKVVDILNHINSVDINEHGKDGEDETDNRTDLLDVILRGRGSG